MKKGEQLELSVKWWKASQPKGLASAGKLEQALKAYETAHGKLTADGDDSALKATLAALDAVETAAKAAATEAARVKGNAEMEATAQVLGKIDLARQRKDAEGLPREEVEGLAQPDAYAGSLRKNLRHLVEGPMNFGFVVGKKTVDHRLVMHRTQGARPLAAKAAGELGLHVFTFGVAAQSEDRPETVLLNLEGEQLPGLAKKGGQMLKAFRPQPFSKIALFVNGQEVADILDPDDTNEADEDAAPDQPTGGQTAHQAAMAQDETARMKRAMEELGPRLRQAIERAPDRRGPLTQALAAFNNAVKDANLAAAQRLLSSLTAEVDRLIAAGPEVAAGTVQYTKLMLDWNSARQAAAARLKSLEQAILKDFEGEDDYDEASVRIRKLDVILATLAGELQDKLDEAMNAPVDARPPIHEEALEIIARYKGYVDTDAFVAAIESNPYQPVNVKSGLSATLANLNQALAA